MRKIITIILLAGAIINTSGQIIADHTVVDKYDKIPEYYINEVKKMMVAFPGESHSAAYRTGMELLEAFDSKYACNVSRAESYTDQYVRVENWGWTGENVWFTSGPSSYLESSISSYNTAGHPFIILGFAWCSDMVYGTGTSGIDPVYGVHWFGQSEGGPEGNLPWGLDNGDYSITGNSVNLNTYLSTMEDYITFCKTNSPKTKMVFTTGPVDSEGWWTGENAYQGHIKHEAIRNYVKAGASRILFDYADILCYDDNGILTTQTWDGHVFPSIAPVNELPRTTGHISNAGAIRLAKAQWWLLARIAGWDGIITDVKKNEQSESLKIYLDLNNNKLKIENAGEWTQGHVSICNSHGQIIDNRVINSDKIIIDISSFASGIYYVAASCENKRETHKVIVTR